jgi:uncharacterized protein with NRDE domain
LVSGFLLARSNNADYLERLRKDARRYNGFNLIFGEQDRLYWYSNRGNVSEALSAGIYGLSNHLLDTPWPKVRRGKQVLKRLLATDEDLNPEIILTALQDHSRPVDEDLPETGIGLDWERILSPMFISSPTYGTRSSTILLITRDDHVTFVERSYLPNRIIGDTRRFDFQI